MTSKDIYYSVCHIETIDNERKSEGTCFLYSYDNNLYVISNKHIICGNNNNRYQMTLNLNVKNAHTSQYLNIETTIPIDFNNIIKSDKYDIAIYPINNIREEFITNGYNINHYMINNFDIIENYDGFDFIEQIYCIGYPCNFTDCYTNRPLITNGIVSSPLSLMFKEGGLFYTDITTYNGSSGSPVFIRKDEAYKLIGIMCGILHKPINVKNVIVDSQKINDISGETESLISMCVKADIIKELLQ